MRCKQKLLQGVRVLGKFFRAVVPILFGTKGPVLGKTVFLWNRMGGEVVSG